MHGRARTIWNGDVITDLRRIGIYRLNGVCHSLAFVLSLLSCFFCLDSLFWHGLASLNLVVSTQHHYSAQIDFDMHEFKLFLSSPCIEISSCVWYQMKEEKLPLIMKHMVWLNIAWQWRYLTNKTGFLFIGTYCIERYDKGWCKINKQV